MASSRRYIGIRPKSLTAICALIAFSSSGCGSENASQATDVPPAAATAASTTGKSGTPPARPVVPPAAAAAAPAAGAAAPAASATTPPATTAAATVTTPAAAPGGDEEGIRVPAAFTVAPGRVTPAQITVPPFLRIELQLKSGDGAAHRFTLRTPTPVTVAVPASGVATQTVDGLEAGTYEIVVDDGAAAGRLTAADDAVGP